MLRQRHIVGKSIKICGNECTPKNVKKAGLPRLKNYQSLHHIYNTKIKTSPARQSSSKNQEKILKKVENSHKKQKIWQPYHRTGTRVYTKSTEAPKLKYTQYWKQIQKTQREYRNP